MPRVTVRRNSSYADMARAYVVLIDGRAVGTLRRGEEKTFDVPAGRHALALKIDWCGSKPMAFTLGEGETAAFVADSNLQGLRLLLALWYVIAERDAYLTLDRVA